MEQIPGYRLDRARSTVRRLRRYIDTKAERFEASAQDHLDRQALVDIEWLLDNELAKREVNHSGHATQG